MADDPFGLPPEHTEERPVSEAARLLLGGPVALVTTVWKGQPNVMPLAWHMPVSTHPPLVAIAVEQSRYTADLISHAQQFALNFPKRAFLHHVQYLGNLRGEAIDKIEATQWEMFFAYRITAPLLMECAAWLECEVVEVYPTGDHLLFIAEVVAMRVDPDSYDTDLHVWKQDAEDNRPLHFLGGNRYAGLTRAVEARVPRDFEAPERILRERIEEELELSREAREKREERVEALREEVRRGNVVDVDALEFDIPDADLLDLSKGFILPPSEPE